MHPNIDQQPTHFLSVGNDEVPGPVSLIETLGTSPPRGRKKLPYKGIIHQCRGVFFTYGEQVGIYTFGC